MEKYLEYLEVYRSREEVAAWVKSTLKNYLAKNSPSQDEVEHIIDYLRSEDAPKNIAGMAYDEAKKNTEKWNAALMKKGAHIKETEKDTEVVLDFKDGFKIVKLVGKAAYDREGYLMRHCVASYYGKSVEIYSLRDKDNMPHCTMEKDNQIKGKGNGDIHPNYVEYVVKFLEHVGMTVGDNEMRHLGYMNVEKIKKELSKDMEYFNKKYVPSNAKLLGVDGNEFASLDLLDYKPLVSETTDSLKINFELPSFIKLSFEYMWSKTKKVLTNVKTDKGETDSKLAASGHSSKLAASGHYSKLAASGDYSQLAASGHSSKLAASGDYSQLAASGDYSKLAASGHYSQLAASGDYSQLAASGHYSKLAASGDYSKLAASGDYSKLAASGHYSKLAASGHYSKLAASGDSSKLAASGHSSKLAASGDYSKLAASGDYSQLAASGHSSQLAASGDSSKLAASGDYAIIANIGKSGKAKGIIGSWIVLAEYDSNYHPICVRSEQIDGKKYKAETWYTLKAGEFVETEE